MKEFKIILKVDHTNPLKTLQRLGELVVGKDNAFDGVDIDFVQNQDFITAVPVEIALTTELRANLLYHNPDCRFVITGVPVQRISNLTEYGYVILHSAGEGENPPDEEIPTEEEESPESSSQTSASGEDGQSESCEQVKEVPVEAKYWLNGELVSKEKFDEATKDFRFKLKDMGFLFKRFENLFDFESNE